MRTLIRASQLHPDISGLVVNYASGTYPTYNNISGISGIDIVKSGSYLLISPEGNENVREINNLTGSIFIDGESGVYTRIQNQTIYLGYSGGGGTVQLVTGYGNVNVFKLNDSTYAVSGISITGTNGIETLYNPFKTLLTIKGAGIGKLNNVTGNANLIGSNGIAIDTSGQTITIDASSAAKSGVNSINSLQGAATFITGGTDIGIDTVSATNNIIVNYTGIGWGGSLLYNGENNDVYHIGDTNYIENVDSSFIGGNNNFLINSTGNYLLNNNDSNYLDLSNSVIINSSNSNLSGIAGSTIINGTINNSVLRHPYAVVMGGGLDNTFSTNFQMKAFLSGKEVLKPYRVPKTNYSGIYLSTGTIIYGEVSYVAVRYDVTHFEASFDVKNFGIYGKKHFIAQRATELQVTVKDEADLFGGIDKYATFFSGGNDGCLYLLASGFSGNDPSDGLDGVHDLIFMANINFTNFNVSPFMS